MKIYIKNICCACCEHHVRTLTIELGLRVKHFQLGEMEFAEAPTPSEMSEFEHKLKRIELGLEFDHRRYPAEKVKFLIRDLVNQELDPLKINLSDYLAEKLGYNYSYLSHLFTQYEGMTIRDFGAQLRIERVKEMLTIQNLDLATISERLRFSSVSHLSSQFKRLTGQTTTEYKQGAMAA